MKSLYQRTPPTLLFFVLTGLLFIALSATACGKDDEACRNDHECNEDQVCEPAGCRLSCTEDEDCRAAQACSDRRVEEGKVCLQR